MDGGYAATGLDSVIPGGIEVRAWPDGVPPMRTCHPFCDPPVTNGRVASSFVKDTVGRRVQNDDERNPLPFTQRRDVLSAG